LNIAVERTQKEGWISNVFAGTEDELETLRSEYGLDLPLFVELYVVLSSFWKADVFLRPLTHQFLRGAVQIVGRFTSFVDDGLEGKIKFGEEIKPANEENGLSEAHGEDVLAGKLDKPIVIRRDPYVWGEVLEDVAAVAWELTVLESKLTHAYTDAAMAVAIDSSFSPTEKEEMSGLVRVVLEDAASKVAPIVQKAWNDVIVNLLVSKCSGPLGAVRVLLQPTE
jgi:hypothetical protein